RLDRRTLPGCGHGGGARRAPGGRCRAVPASGDRPRGRLGGVAARLAEAEADPAVGRAALAVQPGGAANAAGVLIEVGAQPALGLGDRHAAARRIILELVAADPGDSEILAVTMAEVETGDGRGRPHRVIFGERDPARSAAE